ncbi:SDR family oxidoreductase [Pseudofrankia saprophytica]|uniref:SDR family oxidoreductase n=1 Tax=Pseudofrankia saprophytica TaxID=298655 RepID=UPI000234CDDA|nr:SDR family oxidoreductase [Pseudofrankia saprophytica]
MTAYEPTESTATQAGTQPAAQSVAKPAAQQGTQPRDEQGDRSERGRRPTALVTGASRGIGRAVALALAADGYDVAITARTVREGDRPHGLPGSLDSTAAEAAALGARVVPVRLDLLDADQLAPAVEGVLDAFGRLDVLVNNAIYVGPGGDAGFLDVSRTEIERRIYANLTAQLLLTQRVVRAMVDAGGGTVVGITSAAGTTDPRSGPGTAGGWAVTYGCSKGGFHRMAGAIAAELGGRGIRCFNVEPGPVATERVLARPDLRWVAEYGRPPEAVGAVVAWLLRQPDGAVPNGDTISVTAVAPALEAAARGDQR